MKGLAINNGQGGGGSNITLLGGAFVIDDGIYVPGATASVEFVFDDGVYEP